MSVFKPAKLSTLHFDVRSLEGNVQKLQHNLVMSHFIIKTCVKVQRYKKSDLCPLKDKEMRSHETSQKQIERKPVCASVI